MRERAINAGRTLSALPLNTARPPVMTKMPIGSATQPEGLQLPSPRDCNLGYPRVGSYGQITATFAPGTFRVGKRQPLIDLVPAGLS